MLRATFKGLLLGVALVAAAPTHARAQGGGPAPEKRAAIRQLLEVTTPARHMNFIFERLMTRYQGPWSEALKAEPRISKALNSFTPEQRPTVERLIKEFSDNLFSEIKRRFGSEIVTPENLEPFFLSALDKHFTLDEINALVALFQSPTGRKFLAAYPHAAADAAITSFERRGLFDSPASFEAQAARLNRFDAEVRADPSALFQSATKYFDEQDARALYAFQQQPLARKLAEVSPKLSAEIAPAFFVRYGPRFRQLAEEVYRTQLHVFASKLYKAVGGAGGGTPQRGTTGRARTRALKDS